MTLEALAALPVGSIVRLDDGEEGEILRTGQEVWIMWPDSKLTNIIDCKSEKWYGFVKYLEAE